MLPYFINQAVSTIKKATSFRVHYYGDSEVTLEVAKDLAAASVEDEILFLYDMYGHLRGTFTLSEIAARQLTSLPSTTNGAIAKELCAKKGRISFSSKGTFSLGWIRPAGKPRDCIPKSLPEPSHTKPR